MNLTELKAAAERVAERVASGQGYGTVRDSEDRARLVDFAVPLLSDKPVTAEWLREMWNPDHHKALNQFSWKIGPSHA